MLDSFINFTQENVWAIIALGQYFEGRYNTLFFIFSKGDKYCVRCGKNQT